MASCSKQSMRSFTCLAQRWSPVGALHSTAKSPVKEMYNDSTMSVEGQQSKHHIHGFLCPTLCSARLDYTWLTKAYNLWTYGTDGLLVSLRQCHRNLAQRKPCYKNTQTIKTYQNILSMLWSNPIWTLKLHFSTHSKDLHLCLVCWPELQKTLYNAAAVPGTTPGWRKLWPVVQDCWPRFMGSQMDKFVVQQTEKHFKRFFPVRCIHTNTDTDLYTHTWSYKNIDCIQLSFSSPISIEPVRFEYKREATWPDQHRPGHLCRAACWIISGPVSWRAKEAKRLPAGVAQGEKTCLCFN